jgi:hypothetical protein
MTRVRTTLLVSAVLFTGVALLFFGRLGLRYYGKPHQRFQFGSESYDRDFAAACDALLIRYGTNEQTTLFSDPQCLVPNLSETNFIIEGKRFVEIPIGKAGIPSIIGELDPLLVTVHGDELVRISLYRPARGGFHVRWSRRQWSEDRNSLSYFWDPERPPTTVYRDQSNQGSANQTVQRTGASRSAQETNRTSSAAGSDR